MIQNVRTKNEDDLEKVSVFRLYFALHFKDNRFLRKIAISIFFQL